MRGDIPVKVHGPAELVPKDAATSDGVFDSAQHIALPRVSITLSTAVEELRPWLGSCFLEYVDSAQLAPRGAVQSCPTLRIFADKEDQRWRSA